MDKNQIIKIFQREFPGKTIVSMPEAEPEEIICETDPASLHPDHSEAVAFIRNTKPHRHANTKETYTVEDGTLTLFINGVKQEAGPGRVVVINPGIIHWASGTWARVRVKSEPGWTQEDHISVDEARSAGGIIIDRGKVILVILPDGKLTFPKGHIEEGETEDIAALREATEETGIKNLKIERKLGAVIRPAVERNGRIVIKEIHLFRMTAPDYRQNKAEEETIWLTKEEALPRMFSQESEMLRFLDF